MLADFARPHRLHDILQFDSFANVLPLLDIIQSILLLYRRTSVHFELSMLIDVTMLGALILTARAHLLQNTLILRHRSVDTDPHPSYDLAAEALVVTEVEASERLRLSQKRD